MGKPSTGIGVSEWRDMMESGNPSLVKMAEELEAIDRAMVESGAMDEPKYYWGSGGRGGSGGGSGKISTSI